MYSHLLSRSLKKKLNIFKAKIGWSIYNLKNLELFIESDLQEPK